MMPRIREMILELCKNQKWDWKGHIESVVNYSKALSKKYGADQEVCELAAWLHDIKKLRGNDEKHHIFGAEEAEQILRSFGYSEKKIVLVKNCILKHSFDKSLEPESTEEKILSTADALTHFDNFLGLAHHIYSIANYSCSDGREWLIKKYRSEWDKIKFPEEKEITKQKYAAIKSILGEQN